MGTLALVPAMMVGCGDDDGTAGGGTGGGGGVACVEPTGVPAACGACICEKCPSQLAACDATANCDEDVACAQAAIANGTCDVSAGQTAVLSCLATNCGAGGTADNALEPQALAYLICIGGNESVPGSGCTAECTAPQGDGGTGDAGL